MNHDAMKNMLFALYDGELAVADRREAEAHLAGCADCRQASVRWQRTARALFRAPDIHASDAFVRRVMGRIDALEEPRRAAPWIATLRWLAPAVSLAGLLLVIGPMERAVSVETLLLGEETDDALGFIMEAQP